MMNKTAKRIISILLIIIVVSSLYILCNTDKSESVIEKEERNIEKSDFYKKYANTSWTDKEIMENMSYKDYYNEYKDYNNETWETITVTLEDWTIIER